MFLRGKVRRKDGKHIRTGALSRTRGAPRARGFCEHVLYMGAIQRPPGVERAAVARVWKTVLLCAQPRTWRCSEGTRCRRMCLRERLGCRCQAVAIGLRQARGRLGRVLGWRAACGASCSSICLVQEAGREPQIALPSRKARERVGIRSC